MTIQRHSCFFVAARYIALLQHFLLMQRIGLRYAVSIPHRIDSHQ
jgi:hypothetical protein